MKSKSKELLFVVEINRVAVVFCGPMGTMGPSAAHFLDDTAESCAQQGAETRLRGRGSDSASAACSWPTTSL